jgi:hypothetical protein
MIMATSTYKYADCGHLVNDGPDDYLFHIGNPVTALYMPGFDYSIVGWHCYHSHFEDPKESIDGWTKDWAETIVDVNNYKQRFEEDFRLI